MPRFDDIINRYDEICEKECKKEYRTNGTQINPANNIPYAQITFPGWPTKVHCEFRPEDLELGIELHNEL